MASQPNTAFLAHLSETLAGAMPGGSAEERCDAARAALEALQPCDIVEAMLAARVIAAHHATMDGYRRAMDVRKSASPAEQPRIAVSRDVPRDTSGNPVPLWRGDGVTMDERGMSHDEPPDGEQQVIGEVHRERRPTSPPG